MYNFHSGDSSRHYKSNLAHIYRNPDSTATIRILETAINSARNVRSYTSSYTDRLKSIERDRNSFETEKLRKYTQAVACFVMFLIGAPLGAIIKRGGLGFPVIISISFFIVYYIISVMGEKLAVEGVLSVNEGMWLANFILIPFGLYFMNKARNDSRLLEFDFITQIYGKLVDFITRKLPKKQQ
jgi:lipopolysaccharide export system permease protein